MRAITLAQSVLAATLLLPVTATLADNAKKTRLPVLQLDAQVYTEIAQDTVSIILQATRQSSEQNVVTKELAETVTAVLAEAKQQDKVKISSGNYYVRPQYDKDGTITAWTGQSQLVFESTDMSAASELAAKYQDKMPVANISFSVSKKARSEAEQALMLDVAEAFSQRAKQMSSALGYQDFSIKEINLGGSGAVYRNAKSYNEMQMMAAAPAMSDALPINSGTEDISLSVNGSVYLLDKK